MNVGAKIYYDKSTGSVVLNTGERSGDVKATSTDEDFTAYQELSGLSKSAVGYVQLDYGQYRQEFASCTSYKVNITTKEIEFSYA